MWFGVTPLTRGPITVRAHNPPARAKRQSVSSAIPGNDKLVDGAMVKRKEARLAEFLQSWQIPTLPRFGEVRTLRTGTFHHDL